MSNFRPIITAQYQENTAPVATLQNFAANTILSNLTGGSAAPVENTTAAVAAALINDAGTTSSDILSASKIQANIDAAIAGLDFQSDVLDIQTDATLDPGVSPATGARYLITNSAALHANFGTITGVGNNDIVEYDGADFVVSYDVSTKGEGALVWDQDSNTFQRYNGTNWAEFGGLSGITAGNGLDKLANDIFVGAGNGIAVAADSVAVQADGTGGANLGTVVDVNANGVAIKINDTTIGENVSNQLEVKTNSINENHLTTSTFGAGLTGGNGTPATLTGDVLRLTPQDKDFSDTTTAVASLTHNYVDASGGVTVLDLPASPDANTFVQFFLADATNKLTVDGNGKNIAIGTTATTLDLTIAGEMVSFRFNVAADTYYWF